jgi:ribose transport system substrate-binding protein
MKNSKLLLISFFVLIFTLFTIIVGGIAFAEEQVIVGFTLSSQASNFWKLMIKGADDAAKELNIELRVLNANEDPDAQISQVEDLIQAGATAIMINCVDSTAIVPGIEKANEANIPVILVDRTTAGGEIATFIGSDNVQAGELEGEYIVKRLNGKGKVVALNGPAGIEVSRQRYQGFLNAIKDYPDIEVVSEMWISWDQAEVMATMEDILQAQPEINAVFTFCDPTGLGAIAAIEGAGRQEEMFVASINGDPEGLDAVKKGRMAATVSQSPYYMGRYGVEFAKMVSLGFEIAKNLPIISTPCVTVDTSNVEDFIKQQSEVLK